MLIALAQYNYHIGNFESNIRKIITGIEKAKRSNADLVVFAELSVCGYPSGDFLEFNDYINKCYQAVDQIAQHCKGIAAIVGAPDRNPNPKGKPLYNAAFFIEDQKVKQIFHKGLLPNYDIFEEYRYFEPATEFEPIEFKGKRIALTICEDLWNLNDNPLYVQNPMGLLADEEVDFMINIAASPFAWDHGMERKIMLAENAKRYKLPLFYVNHVGAQTELLFDGSSLVINPHGEIIRELKSFEEDFMVVSLESALSESGPSLPIAHDYEKEKTELTYKALVMGVKDYFDKLGFSKAILGLSGGIDSAVTLVIAAEALGPQNILAVLMPGEFSSDHSVKDALDLVKNLGCPHCIINITESSKSFEKNLEPYFKELPFNVAEENIQARSRAVYLMALSNKFGYVLLNTSNKSEAAVGYGTLYGDMCGGLSVIGDVYKTDVFRIARYINRKEEIIPENTIIKPPSAELRPNQKDSDSLPEYDLLDKILFQYIEKRKGPDELIRMGFEKEFTDRVLKLVNTNEYKRHQTPPILRVSGKAFGMGRKMPIVAKYLG
jgi:NAD+ synthase (glutamine-hydrolysing)